MPNLGFGEFAILFVISAFAAAVLHYGFKIYITTGFSSYVSKVIVGWVGAWLGTPVFGYWFNGLAYDDVYFIPAFLGALAVIFLIVDIVKTLKQVTEGKVTSESRF